MRTINRSLLLFLAFGLILALFPLQRARAFSNVMPDGADTSGSASVRLFSGNTTFVQRSQSTLRVWLPAGVTATTLTIANYNFCATNPEDLLQKGDYYANNPLANGSTVTNFVVKGVTYAGKKYASGDARCNDNLSVPVSGVTSVENGFNYFDVVVNFVLTSPSRHPGLMNGYYLASSNASSYIGARYGTSGYSTTQSQLNTTPNFVTYYAPFGTNCALTTNQSGVKIYFYDLDNAGGGGAQPVGSPVTIQLKNLNSGALVDFTAYGTVSTTTSSSVGTTWTPPSLNNASQWVSFTAVPNTKYQLIINNVYYNNTIQYSVPYSQIYRLACPAPKSATLTPTATPASQNLVLSGASVSGSISYKVDATSANVGGDTFRAQIADSSGTTTSKATYTSGALAIAGANPRFGIYTENFTFNSPGKYCRTISVPTKPAYATSTTAEACIFVTKTSITPWTYGAGTSNPVPDFEKGGADINVDQGFSANVCDGTGNPHTVYWSTSSPSGDGSPNLSNQPYSVPDCSTVNPKVSTATISAATLNGKVAGYQYQRQIIVTYNGVQYGPTVGSGTVYEVPFTRFFGSDTLVCGDGDNNQFMFDTANGVKGSFGNLATIFRALGANPFAGLHSQDPGSHRDYLHKSWSGIGGCSSPSITPPAQSASAAPVNLGSAGKRYYTTSNTSVSGGLAGQVTVVDSGNVTITGNITSSFPTGNFSVGDLSTAPVLVIKANNIYINPGVTRVDAILIASQGIYTCGTLAQNLLDNNCNTSLTINGALYADKIHFMRSLGTRLLANTSTSSPGFGPNGSTTSDAAEVVNYPAYLNFMSLNLQDLGSTAPDAYYNMPPRL